MRCTAGTRGCGPGWKKSIAYVMAVACSEMVTTAAGRSRADALAALVPASGWQRLSCADGSKGPRLYDWALIGTTSPGQQLLARRSLPGREGRAGAGVLPLLPAVVQCGAQVRVVAACPQDPGSLLRQADGGLELRRQGRVMAGVPGPRLLGFSVRRQLLRRELAQALQHRELSGLLVTGQPPDQALLEQRLHRREHFTGGQAAHAGRVRERPAAGEHRQPAKQRPLA